MVKAPVVTTLAMADPLIDPIPALAARGGIGQIDEEFARARHLQKGAEQDEDKDKGRRYPKRQPEYAFGPQGHLAGDPFQRIAAMVHDAGHPIGKKRHFAARARKGIGDKGGADDRHAKTHGAACALQHDQNGQNAHPDIDVARKDLIGDDVDVDRHPSADHHAAQDQGCVDDPAGDAAWVRRPPDGIDQETQDKDKTQMDRALIEQAKRLDTRGVKMKQRQHDADHGDRTQHDRGLWVACHWHVGIGGHPHQSPVSSIRTRCRGARADSETICSPTRSR